MNVFLPRPAGGRRQLPVVQAICLAVLACACIGVWHAGQAAVAAVRRELPWGQRVGVEVIVSLAVDPDDPEVRALRERWRPAAPSGAGEGSSGWVLGVARGLGERLRSACARLAQVEVCWRLDVAAEVVVEQTRTALVLPLRVRILEGDGVVTITGVRADGTVSASVAGRPVTLQVGEGHDLALVPAGGGLWAAEAGQPWREVILSRLGDGLAAGRLSVLNLGVGESPERRGAPVTGIIAVPHSRSFR